MPACFKNWFKSIGTILLIHFFHFNATGQAAGLLPEANRVAGLPSDAVRCIALDKEGRVWTGTDNGLSILNTNSITQKNIISAIGNKSIWGLNFFDSLVFVGTRFDGLYVFNRYTGKRAGQYSSDSVTLIRKIKVLNRQVFILTNKGAFRWSANKIIKLKFTEKIKDDFPTDMFYWQGALYALSIRPFTLDFNVLKFDSDGFEEVSTDKFLPSNNKKTLLCAQSNGNKLVIGGHGFYTVIEETLAPKMFTIPLRERESYAVWDIVITKDDIILALGENNSGSKGSLYVHGKTVFKTREDSYGYITSLAWDTAGNSLYYGELNKGLFLQKSVNRIIPINKEKRILIVGNKLNTFFYDEREIFKVAVEKTPSVNYHLKASEKADILFSKLFGDTLIVTTNKYIKFYNTKSLKVIKTIAVKNSLFSYPDITSAELFNNNLIVFPNYSGGPFQIDLSDNRISVVKNIESFLPVTQQTDDKIIFLNKEKGFNVIEKDKAYPLNCTDKTIAFAEDYVIIKNNLYTLLNNTIKSFNIDYKSHQLLPGKIFDIGGVIEGFTAKWLLTKNDKLYLLNEKGILQTAQNTGEPVNYYYLGNYNHTDKPVIAGDELIVATSSMLTKISFNEIDKPVNGVNPKNLVVRYPEAVNENLGFTIDINYPDYLLQNHSLKVIEITKNGKEIGKKYILANQFRLPTGLTYGDYDIAIKMGNALVRKEISISLPLNRNPYFFGAIILFVIVTLLLVLKSRLDKKEFNKKLMQNRLQVLKQNLNPHFVYNSMNLISSLILEEKYDRAVEVVAEFSNLQRTYLETNNKDAITLTEELKFLDSYLKLQQTRFHYDNDFAYQIKVTAGINTDNIRVPPLILQPLAENAIKYGVISSNAADKKIWLEVSGTNPVIIALEDNGNDDAMKEHGLGLGQQLVKERIDLFNYTHKQAVSIFYNKPPLHNASGYRVEIHIG